MISDVVMEPVAFIDMALAVAICPVEISGLGKLKIDAERQRCIVTETIIFDQKCSWHGTEFDPLAISRFYHSLMVGGHGPEIDLYRFWWHSHVYGPVLWSPTDNNTIDSWRSVGFAEYWISMVLNKLGNSSLRIDYFNPPLPTEHFLYSRIKLTENPGTEALDKLFKDRRDYISGTIKNRVRFVR